MKQLLLSVATTATVLFSSAVLAHNDHDLSSGPQSHAPIGVMGDHVHKQGEWMFSYRYMTMDMRDNLDGSDKLSTRDVHARGYRIAPEQMTMQMHMLGGMYAFNDSVTAMVMVPYVINTMGHQTSPMAGGVEFDTRGEGLGDVSLGALFALPNDDANWKSHINASVSLPTGASDEQDRVPMMGGRIVTLPYPMQLGAGSYGLQLGATSTKYWAQYSLGGQLLYKHYLDENDEGYTLGGRANATLWLARKVDDAFSLSTRLAYAHWQDIDESRAIMRNGMGRTMAPTMDPELRAGQRLDFGLGFNTLNKDGLRFAAELLLPVYQNLNGPQLRSKSQLLLGWQYAW